MQRSCHKLSWNIHNIDLLVVGNLKNRRTYTGHNLLKPVSERIITTSGQLLNHPSQRRSLSQSSSDQKSAPDKTYPILQSINFPHWFKKRQELRKDKLTASTFAGAIGFWPPRRTQLWLEKIGALEPFSGNVATSYSIIKEKEALEKYEWMTGNVIYLPEFQVYGKMNPEYSWLAASPDGLVDGFENIDKGSPLGGVLEIKCPLSRADTSMNLPWKRIPIYCIPQAQGLMEIMDRDWMDFYVWTRNGSSLFRIYRDVKYWNVLESALSDFWWKHVQPAKEICSQYKITDPVRELKLLRPLSRHELCHDIIIRSKCIVDKSRLLFREINGQLIDQGYNVNKNW